MDDAVLMEQCRARVGTQLAGKWTLEKLIGVGGMAAVYRAQHRNGAQAAIKMLHPDYAGHPELRARFLREAYIANKVEHVGSVKVLDDDQTPNGEPYLVMELLKGGSVEAYAAKRGGRLPLPMVLNIVDQLLAVLDKAHAVGIVHRDLKPDNVFLTEEGIVKVLDFGIARLRDSADTKKTATGMLMGTPAFMAPEQALGRWDQVDGRTDLWAVGAIIFTLLSGRDVHAGGSANEMLIAAATRPAPSLARVIEAPQPLIEFVDRALAYEQGHRHANAEAMRAALREVAAQIQGQIPGLAELASQPGSGRRSDAVTQAAEITHTTGQATGQSGPASGLASGLPERPSAATTMRSASSRRPEADLQAEAIAVLARGDDLAQAAVTPEDIELLKELFVAMERALIAQHQYTKTHPETKRRFERFFSQVASALMNRDDPLAWNVTPYSFAAGEHTLWEPTGHFDVIPYQLFADGVRLLGIAPGITDVEFMEFLRIITLDRIQEMAPEDDFVTMIWDAQFEHIIHQAIDSFADGGQEERAIFERNVEGVVQLAHFDTSERLEDAWDKHHGDEGNAPFELSQRRLVALVNTSTEVDAESRAQAVRAQMTDVRLDDPVEIHKALAADPATMQVIAARLHADTAAIGERFVVTIAHAFRDARRRDAERSITTPLRSAVDGLSQTAPLFALAMIRSLAEATENPSDPVDTEQVRSALTGAIVSKKTLEFLLAGAQSLDANQELFLEGLEMVLKCVDNTHVPVALEALTEITNERLQDPLIRYLGRAARGYETELGKKFAEADVDLGLALVRVLAAIDTQEARNAISMASRSPHPVVRIEALGHVEGTSSERLRLELRALLEDNQAEVRVAALRAMRKYGIRVAGPFLVLRIRDDGFNRLPYNEREEALRTVSVLAPTRAESIAVEILRDTKMLGGEAHEQTRSLAAELLGDIATSAEAQRVLSEAATKRWKSSERVRVAAAKALGKIEQRAQSAPPRPSGAAKRSLPPSN